MEYSQKTMKNFVPAVLKPIPSNSICLFQDLPISILAPSIAPLYLYSARDIFLKHKLSLSPTSLNPVLALYHLKDKGQALLCPSVSTTLPAQLTIYL